MLVEVMRWRYATGSARFPYDVVRAEYLSVGKHFVSHEVTDALAVARTRLGDPPDLDLDSTLLRSFLHTALDKVDGTYDYESYLGLTLLPMCALTDPPDLVQFARARRDRIVAQLLADLIGFELRALEDPSCPLPEMRPGGETVERRFRLAVRAARPVLDRLGLGEVSGSEPVVAAKRLVERIEPDLSPFDRRLLGLCMLPVYVCHDEYLFLRVLQLFETTFALVAVHLRSAVQATSDLDFGAACEHLSIAEQTLRESTPLFSLLGTMQPEAFRTFRAYTEGASAIQSRNYKVVESLCRRPDQDRLHSAAFESVPDVQWRVLAGNRTLDEALHLARQSRVADDGSIPALEDAMARFATSLLRWRQSHYRLAVNMLGTRTGTGYTEGTPYLRRVQTIPVFRSQEDLDDAEVAADAD